MLEKHQFTSWLEERRIRILDGGLATELEARGHDLNHPLWSAKTLKEDYDSIKTVHLDYFMAGAEVAITASYQASTPGLHEQFGFTEEDGQSLIKRSVQAALEAREVAYASGIDRSQRLLVAGSVGPFGAYLTDGSEYRGDYVRSEGEFKSFHRPRIQALIDEGVDILALETMPNCTEIQAILSLLQSEFPNAIAWLSCTARDAERLSDGTDWESVLSTVNMHSGQIVAFGINCVPIGIVTATLRHIRLHTWMPLLCYPNSGEIWDGESKTWSSLSDDGHTEQTPSSMAERFAHWMTAGAQLIGGCCRTGPDFIRAIGWERQRRDQ